jgi:diacylglycerol kinase (ATP)
MMMDTVENLKPLDFHRHHTYDQHAVTGMSCWAHSMRCFPYFKTSKPMQKVAPMQESPFKGKTGLRRILNALHYSVAGLRAAFRHEDAFRQEVLLAAVLIPIALLSPVSGIGKALMVASVLLVIIVELLNSAIEATVDRISLDNHQLAKRAKDIGSAAVLMGLVNVVIVWVLVVFG